MATADPIASTRTVFINTPCPLALRINRRNRYVLRLYSERIGGSLSEYVIIAIDGPAGSGKSTTARAVARRLGYLYLDTGAMYRAVALEFIRRNEDPVHEAAERLLPSIRINFGQTADGPRVLLNDEDVTEAIRRPAVTAASSTIAALPAVREKLVAEQRRIARQYGGGGVVLEGRDIGTVVFPDADVKIFMNATDDARARRRFDELVRNEEDVTFEDVLEDIRRRDERDATRAIAPLRKAEDAIDLDTSQMDIEQQIGLVIQAVKERE